MVPSSPPPENLEIKKKWETVAFIWRETGVHLMMLFQRFLSLLINAVLAYPIDDLLSMVD